MLVGSPMFQLVGRQLRKPITEHRFPMEMPGMYHHQVPEIPDRGVSGRVHDDIIDRIVVRIIRIHLDGSHYDSTSLVRMRAQNRNGARTMAKKALIMASRDP